MIKQEAIPLNNHHGTVRQGRHPEALSPDSLTVDGRSVYDLLAIATAYARRVRFYDENGHSHDPKTGEAYNWSVFFENDESVYLANILATDIHEQDEAIQTAFLNIHEFPVPEWQVENLAVLVKSLLQLTKILGKWYAGAKALRGYGSHHPVEMEIERALLGDLGIQLEGFAGVLNVMKGKKTRFPDAEEWSTSLITICNGWPKNKEKKKMLGLRELKKAGFPDLVSFAGARLQEYYRRLYFTLTYLEEIVPDLFNTSITERNDHQPEVALLIAFLRLFGHAQAELNNFNERHLNYYYDKRLGLQPRPRVPDCTIVSAQVAPGINELTLPEGTRLQAGVNTEGIPSYYRIIRDLSVSPVKIAALSTLFVSKNPLVKTGSSYRLVTATYAASVANSYDGKGGSFPTDDASWPVLGEDQFDLGGADRRMEASETGFAVCSGMLAMAEGERSVTVDLCFTAASFSSLAVLLDDLQKNAEDDLSESDVFRRVFNRPFRLFLTTEEGWMPVDKYLVVPPEDKKNGTPSIRLRFILSPSAPPITGYAAAVHGEGFETPWPVLRVLLNDGEPIFAYSFLRELEIEKIDIDVAVKGLRRLSAYNDQGLLETSVPFQPFGPLPRRGSYLLFGNAELFNKQLTEMDLHLEWGDLPDAEGGLAEHYAGYGENITEDAFRFRISALSEYTFRPVRKEEQPEFELFVSGPKQPGESPGKRVLQLGPQVLRKLQISPLHRLTELEEFSSATRTGYFRMDISNPPMVFGHALYPRLFTQLMTEQARPQPFSLLSPAEPTPPVFPNEPYTPLLTGMRVDYCATTSIKLNKLDLGTNDPAADNRLYRIHPFGTELVFGGGKLKPTYLLPRFDHDGYLMIGLSALNPPQALTLFFDITDSKKRYGRGTLSLEWQYLQEGEWQKFSPDQILSDTTMKLSTRGIVRLLCPETMTRGDGMLDPQLHWIRAAASGNMSIVGRCTSVVPNAVIARWEDNGDVAHLASPPHQRPLVTDVAEPFPGLTGITQLVGFHGGRPRESTDEFYVRSSERLRHKGRAINIWDIERLVLEHFEEVYQVKAIGRHGQKDYPGCGEVLVVVIPRIDGRDRRPVVGYHLLEEIESRMAQLIGPFVELSVSNPVYESVKISCDIKLTPEGEQHRGQIWKELDEAVTRFICPWLTNGVVKLGGGISKTEVLAVINAHSEVVFVTGFSMVQVFGGAASDEFALKDTAVPAPDAEILVASQPGSVLVPVDQHDFTFLERDEYRFAEAAAISNMQLGTDFVVTEADDAQDTSYINTPPIAEDDDFELPEDWLTA